MKTAKTFQQLFAKAKLSPIYWLEGLDLRFSERIYRYKMRQKRATSIEKKRNYGSKIRSLKECLQDVRSEMRRLRWLRNDARR